MFLRTSAFTLLLTGCSLFATDSDDEPQPTTPLGEALVDAPITLTGYRTLAFASDVNDDGVVDLLIANDNDPRGTLQLHWDP